LNTISVDNNAASETGRLFTLGGKMDRNSAEYWERKLELLKKQEKEFLKKEEKEKEKEKEQTKERRKAEMATAAVVLLHVFVFLILWGLLGNAAAAAFIWLLIWAAFGSVMETKTPKKGGSKR